MSAILVINGGSTTLKAAVYFRGNLRQLLKHNTAIGDRSHACAIRDMVAEIGSRGISISAVGHRVAHGGEKYSGPALITADVEADIAALCDLAPLHQPHHLAAIRGMREALPDVPQVACFDTSFHRTIDRAARTMAIPHQMTKDGIIRYGFHGTSYEYVISRLRRDGWLAGRRGVIIAHLGGGCSICATLDGKSVDCTMGFTPIDGVPMGTRCGSIDPGAILYMMRRYGHSVDAMERILYRESGLLGMSGASGDMKALTERDDERADEAIDVFCLAVAKHIGAMAASIGGVELLVFTGGIGERSPRVRSEVMARLSWIGAEIHIPANAANRHLISADDSRIPVLVTHTNEELMIARHVRDIVTKTMCEAA